MQKKMKINNQTTPDLHVCKEIINVLNDFFSEATTAEYLRAINTFVRQRIEVTTPDECAKCIRY
jgi:lipopolysaccharide biosynthesis regulator YciM